MTWSDGPGVVELPDGRRVRARGLRHGPPPDPHPQLGVYLLGRPPPDTPWPARWIRWPDFRLPTDPGAALATLHEAHDRATTERVELACGGGVGRTGTALAVSRSAAASSPTRPSPGCAALPPPGRRDPLAAPLDRQPQPYMSEPGVVSTEPVSSHVLSPERIIGQPP